MEMLGPETLVKNKGRLRMSRDEKEMKKLWKEYRVIAVALGAVTGRAFGLKPPKLAEGIAAVTGNDGELLLPNFVDMSDDAVKTIAGVVKDMMGDKRKYSDLSEEEAAAIKDAVRKIAGDAPASAPAPEPEPEPEPAEEVAEEPPPEPKKRTPRKRASKKPTPPPEEEEEADEEVVEEPKKRASRKPSSKKPATPPRRAPAKASASVDLSVSEETNKMVRLIGHMVEKMNSHSKRQAEAVDRLTADVAALQDQVSGIEAHLKWLYNRGAEAGKEISSLDSIDWESSN